MDCPVPFVFKVEKRLCEEIDRYCAESGDYRSRAEFGRAAFEGFLRYAKNKRLPMVNEQKRELEVNMLRELENTEN